MAKWERITDEQWAFLEKLIPVIPRRADGRGRPQEHDDRSVLNGVLWILRTGASWGDLPDRFPSPTTCFRRFSRWVRTGVMRKILEALARDLEERGKINLEECFIDGTFVAGKKGATKSGKPSAARAPNSWSSAMLLVFRSPCTRLLLRHMKSPLSKRPSLKPSPWDDPDELSGIVPMTVIHSIKRWQKPEWS
jgi:transposase